MNCSRMTKFLSLKIVLIVAANLTSESKQLRSIKNEELKRKKVTQEVTR